MTIGAVEFLRPWWLMALLAVPWLVWALARSSGGQGGWRDIVATALQPYVLVDAERAARRYGMLLLLTVSLLAGAIALAGPSWREQATALNRGGDPLVIALDLSRSMDVADLKPSRLERAKIKLFDLLERRGGKETALIVYSANAFTVVPLTDDAETIAALINSLTTDIMPSRGSYPAAAITKAEQLLLQAGHSSGSVLLLADGGYSSVAADAAAGLAERGFSLSVLGIGTADGGPVPAVDGGFETDRAGRVAVVALEETDLRRLAAAGNGDYVRIRVDDGDIDRLLAATTAGPGGTTDTTVDVRADDGIWFVLAMLPLTALLFRRGWVLCLALVVALPLARPAVAFEFADLWQTREQQAAAAFEKGDHQRAAELAADPERRAAAYFRQGEFAKSAAALERTESARALYNRGNALARGGEFEAAIAAYDAALGIEPAHADAAHNRAVVAAALNAQQQEGNDGERGEDGQNGGNSEQGGGESGGESTGESGGDSSPAMPEDAAAAESSEAEAGDEAGDNGPLDEAELDAMLEAMQAAGEAGSESAGEAEGEEPLYQAYTAAEREQQEEQQSMEQWLRRIEDDPGGLLRAKFRRQYRRLGLDQDGQSLWPDNEDEPW